jgi:DNA-binding winged helix-turn-helix (wHTH) protein
MTTDTIHDPVKDQLLTPKNAALLIIDYQLMRMTSIVSMDPPSLVPTIVAATRTAKLATANVETGLSQRTIHQLRDLLSGVAPIDGTAMNACEDVECVTAVQATGRKKLIITASLWTEVCQTFLSLAALQESHEVSVQSARAAEPLATDLRGSVKTPTSESAGAGATILRLVTSPGESARPTSSRPSQSDGEEALAFGPFRLFPQRRLLTRDDQPVQLGSRAMALLVALVENAGDTVGKDILIKRAWPDTFVEETNLRVHIAALRRALGDGVDGARYVVNVAGRGYSFVERVLRTGRNPSKSASRP